MVKIMKPNKKKSLNAMRRVILAMIKTHPNEYNLRNLSIALKRNPAYLHQFIYRGTPKVLPEEVRISLASMLNIDEQLLREENAEYAKAAADSLEQTSKRHPPLPLQIIPCIDHPSQASDLAPWLIPQTVIKGKSVKKTSLLRHAVIHETSPDKAFTWGDIVIFNTSDTSPHHAGMFCIDGCDHLRVRHLESPQTNPPFTLIVSHEGGRNGYRVQEDDIKILGRVVLHARFTFNEIT